MEQAATSGRLGALLYHVGARGGQPLAIPKSTLGREGTRTVPLWAMVLFFEVLGLLLLSVWQEVIPPKTMQFRVIAVASLILTWLAAAPFIRFLDRGWYVRYHEFQNALTGSATRTYLSHFWANRIEKYGIVGSLESKANLRHILALTAQETHALFERVYIDQYGIVPFIAPLALIVTIVFGESILAVFLVYHDAKIWGEETPLVVSAIAGAFLFSIGDAVLSVRKRSLNVSEGLYMYQVPLGCSGLIVQPMPSLQRSFAGNS